MKKKAIKKAILTGGGRATRLHPLTTTTNKHLLPLANKPMIFHAIEKAVEAGIEEIFINLNPGEQVLHKHIGDGGRWGIKIEYFEQTGGPQGIPHIVKEGEKFIGDDPFMLYLSDNVLLGGLTDMIDYFNSSDKDCMLALSTVRDPERFGVPVFNEKQELIDVLEKPENPPNNFAVTGIYLYGPKVFFDAYKKIKKSARGEYEISDIHSEFLKKGLKVGHKEITGWWKDTGKSHDLLIASQLLMDGMKEDEYVKQGTVHEDTTMNGSVHVSHGTTIGKNVVLHGPVIIAENCILEDCEIGPHVTIGAGSTVKQATVKNSIVLEHATINTPMKIIDSLIGRRAQLIKRDTNAPEGHKMIIGDKTIIEM